VVDFRPFLVLAALHKAGKWLKMAQNAGFGGSWRETLKNSDVFVLIVGYSWWKLAGEAENVPNLPVCAGLFLYAEPWEMPYSWWSWPKPRVFGNQGELRLAGPGIVEPADSIDAGWLIWVVCVLWGRY
jgi:hypothetical protein